VTTATATARRGWGAAWRREPDLRVGIVLVGAVVLVAALASVLAPGDPAALGEPGLRLQAPSSRHLLGTDPLGRDVLARVVHGSRISLAVGWTSVVAAVCLGLLVGLGAGLGPRWLDRALMALTDVFLAFPRVLLVLLLVGVTRPSLALVMLILGLTGWMDVARLVRAETLSLRERDFVAAARGLGLGRSAIAWRHVLPNVLPTVLVAATLRVGGAILIEAFLSYLGLGAQEPAVSWGGMIAEGRPYLLEAWWLSAMPGVAIAITVLGHNLLGDGLRARFDPRAASGEARDVRP
jgi:peptide/nickel transport system permease protein